MSRRVHPRSTLLDNLKLIRQIMPWRLLLLIPFLLVFAVPAFLLGTGAGHRLLPNLTNFFYNMSNSNVTAVPTPMPPLAKILPQPGGLVYTVQASDSCDEILASQMRMSDAGQIFSDAVPATVHALNSALGKNCSNLQPGDVVTLMPQYPLFALGGIILKVEALSPAQPIPTPLIRVQREKQVGVDCSNGCLLIVRVAQGIEEKLSVQTAIPVPVGAWVWAQAMLPRKAVAGFASYPYADPSASLNGMSLRACDLQINNTRDTNSPTCDQLLPNTINDDGGSWLFGVTGAGALDHWNYHLHLPSGTRVLLWLSLDKNGNLHYRPGDALYRYDEALHLYVKI
ncbi:MAG TPA: hypothetical protein VFV38_23515 [Ktedonobacteraceae bacterium]|nr:hypothetical protein [Ktedonobacteraceae bacterium]